MKITIEPDNSTFMSGWKMSADVGPDGYTWIVGKDVLTVQIDGPIVLDPDPDISSEDTSPFSLCGPPGSVCINGNRYKADLNQKIGPNYYRYIKE